jgi:alpha-L-fucosidase
MTFTIFEFRRFIMGDIEWFENARFGVFVHFGLFSMLGKGEWVMNREGIPPEEYAKLAERFNPTAFDADELCGLAKSAGATYIVFTTMHHEGFRMYDSDLSDYNSVTACGRDLTAEAIVAAKKHGLKIGLYHSLNNWFDQPDAVAALEGDEDYERFIKHTHDRIRELVTKYNPVDIMWYDGWWPFNAEKWRGEAMNSMVSEIQPHIIFNGRNGLDGDFGTPEGHISAPNPWRPWEACMTLNDHWGYHGGDHNWKPAGEVVDMLSQVANGRGNLLLNIGPRGDGSIPEETLEIFKSVGEWLGENKRAIFNTDIFDFGPMERNDSRSDWSAHGKFTASENTLFFRWKYPSGEDDVVICGMEQQVLGVKTLRDGKTFDFNLNDGKLVISGVSKIAPDKTGGGIVFEIECDAPPSMYICGGMRTPNVPHPHYDPLPPDIAY